MKNKDYFLCLVLGLFSLVIRLLLISKGPFSHESLNLALKAEQTLETGQLQYMFGSGYPLTVLIAAGFVGIGKLFGFTDPVVANNLMSAVCSSISVALFYLFVQHLLDRPTAIMSAILLATSPIYLGISVYGKSHAIELIFLFAGLLVLIKYLRTHKMQHLLIGAFLLGLMGGTRLQDLVFVIPSIYFMLVFLRSEKDDRSGARPSPVQHILPLAIFTALIVAVTFLLHAPYIFGVNRADYFAQYQRFRNATFTAEHGQSFLLSWPFYLKWFIQNFSIIGLGAFFMGLVGMLIGKVRLGLFLLLWFIVPFTFYLTIDTTIPRLFVILLPPMIVFICSLLTFFLRTNSKIKRGLSILLFLVIIGISAVEAYPLFYFRHTHALLPDYVRWVQDNTPSETRLILLDDYLFFKHYGAFEILVRPLPGGPEELMRFADFKSELDRLFDQDIPVYTTGVGLYTYDSQKAFAMYLEQFYTVKELDRYAYEDYHAGELNKLVFPNPLIKITPKSLN